MNKLIKNIDQKDWNNLKIIALKKNLTIPETIALLVWFYNQKENDFGKAV